MSDGAQGVSRVTEPAPALDGETPRMGSIGVSGMRYAGLLPVSALLVPALILALVGWVNWKSVWQNTELEMLRAAESAAEYGERTLESYAVAAGRLNDRLRGLSDDDIRRDERSLHDDARAIAAELTQSQLTYALDRDGHVLLSSDIYPVPREVSFTDRDYYRALSGANPPAIYVSQTFVGRLDKRLLFSVSRGRTRTGNPPHANGFDGIVLVSVSPNVLADGMRRLLAAPTDRMAFMRTDGYGISTTSGALDLGQPLPKVDETSPFYSYARRGVKSAVYTSRTAMPGTEAVLAMHRIDGFPLYAVSLRSRSDIVARWWALMENQLAFGIPATLALFLLSLRVLGDQRRLAANNANLQRDNSLSTDRLLRARRFGLVGTFELDPRTRITRRSPERAAEAVPAVIEHTHDEWLAQVHPDDRDRAERELSEALSDASGATHYAQTYRIVTSTGEVRWIAAHGEITRDEQGAAVMLLGAQVDVTPLRTTELALAESDARMRLAQEGVGIGSWEWEPGASVFTSSQRMRELWGFASTESPPDLAAVLARVHREDRRTVLKAVVEARRTGRFSADFRIQRPKKPGGDEILWISALGKMFGPAIGQRSRLVGIVYDITARKRAEEASTLMAREVEHRAKNVLAVVSSLLLMTKADSAKQFADVMQRRVSALSKTMTLLGRDRWSGADLRELVLSQLEPFQKTQEGSSTQVTFSGPPVLVGVDASQPLAMVLHELATNAAKYGALSVPEGRVHLEWRIEGDRLDLVWREDGGPSLNGPPVRSGFGSRLIEKLFEGQLQGVITRRWEPSGLVCELSFHLTE